MTRKKGVLPSSYCQAVVLSSVDDIDEGIWKKNKKFRQTFEVNFRVQTEEFAI